MRHMSGDRSLFLKLDPIDPVEISGAFGSGGLATHVGSISVPGFDVAADRPTDVVLTGVLYCATLPVNLLSLHQLASDGCSFSGNLSTLSVRHLPNGRVLKATKNALS